MHKEREAAKAARKKRRAEKLARQKEKNQQQKFEKNGENHHSGRKEVWIMPGIAAAQEGVASPVAMAVASDEAEQMKDDVQQVEEMESETLSQVSR